MPSIMSQVAGLYHGSHGVPQKTKAPTGPKSNEGAVKMILPERLRDATATAAFFPPDCGVFGPVEHLRQLFLDLYQAVGAHFYRRLINLAVRGSDCRAGVHVP